jgi:hypothetical protein
MHNEEIESLVALLASEFEINDLGEPTHFLGIALVRDGTSLMLSQKHYLENVLKRFHLKDIKAKSTPNPYGSSREA